MNYQLFRPGLAGEFLEKVNQDNTQFLKFYKDQSKFEYQFSPNDFLESNIPLLDESIGDKLLDTYLQFKDDQQVADFECAKILYENLNLTPAQAGNADFWNYLHHFDMYRYIQKRWKIKGSFQTHIKRHFLMNLTSQKHLINFPLTTLWWSIHLTLDDTREDKYELSKVYFSNNRFRTVSLGGMSFVRHKPALLSILEFMKFHKDELTRSTTYTDLGDDISKFINLLGGTKPLSFFDKEWFTAKLKERFNIKSEKEPSKKAEEVFSGEPSKIENNDVLCYFCLNNSGNPNYLISDSRRSDFDYCIEINDYNKNGFLLHFYAEGKIKKTKLDFSLFNKTRGNMFSNGKCNHLTLVGLKIIAQEKLFGIAYSKNGLTKFKAMDGNDDSIFRSDNNSLRQEGKKILYTDYDSISYKLLPYSIKEDLGTLVQTPSGRGADITNQYHLPKWRVLDKHWPELFSKLNL